MLGQIVGGRTGNRYFRYEVAGLRQNEETEQTDYSIRSSATTFVTVPENRMNQEMQRITRMGGKIVNIQPLNAGVYQGTQDTDEFKSADI
jgi:phycocyanin-associated, rod